MARITRLLLLTALLATIPEGLRAADGLGRSEQLRAKITALQTQIESKKAVIRQTWREVARLDLLIAQAGPSPSDAASPEEPPGGADWAEALLDQAFQREAFESQRRQALQSILGSYREVEYLEEEVRSARSQLGQKPLLEGSWTLTILPMGARGQVSMAQSGTLVQGEYVMESGLTGNLQGTFINGQVTLERIDSKYGKMGRLEGQLMKDEDRIQGSWYSYDLQSGNPLTGSFVLERDREGAD